MVSKTKKMRGGGIKKTIKSIMAKIKRLLYLDRNSELEGKGKEILSLEKDLECWNVTTLTETKLANLLEEMKLSINEVHKIFDIRDDESNRDLSIEEIEEFDKIKHKIMSNKYIIEKLLKQIKKLNGKCEGVEEYYNGKNTEFNNIFNKYNRKTDSQVNSQVNSQGKSKNKNGEIRLPRSFYDNNYEEYGFVPPSPSSPAPSEIPIEFRGGKRKLKRTRRPKYFKKR